jgi:hypothetical protein
VTGFNDISAANVQTELGTYGALKPTTAARTLDVTATGEAGIDWANIGAPTTTVNLSGTTIATLTNAPVDSAGVTTLLTRVPAALFSGITSLAQWLGLLAGKQVGNATARTEMRATGAGSGTFDETTDSVEALRDNVGTNGAGLTALGDTRVATINTKVAGLTYTVANQVDANSLTVGDKSGYSLTSDFRIKKNTALPNFTFLMVDAAGNPATGLTITAQRSLDGASLITMANAAAEISNGLYKINLAASDTNADFVAYRFSSSGAKDRIIAFPTQTE